ncbi:Na+/H+ antiporter NhaA [Denitrovibrio acetiphilus DSM 12809]|uniref:Na(+)/H(+) antiporter NhaA n=1 Tax=Denitrovibrio acetiphilus (strain DSM 12809 / NBRC 114555 / N2460) TaxID=522772 RepID=D4H1W6_DENA2|nr:Na+/H+ antiporter NhaA [Denitrovibrio acetiphilus]ADD66943.1 Na+/H+ antiporter NhaA [Denitrovibrio acetiphilus DSM 12809]
MTINQAFRTIAIDPTTQFFKNQSSSSIIMLFSMAAAIILANSPYAGWYHNLWKTELGFALGEFTLYKSAHHWINDGLMGLFFLVIGLEIKREVLIGDLSSVRQALLPFIAAVGGAVVPALIYFALNRNGGNPDGWGVPMATDIAFAIGIMALLGSRVPVQIKIFITSLAVVDDMIAVIVIAVFYTSGLNIVYLAYAAGIIILLFIMNIGRVRSIMAYLIVGTMLWYFFLKSGIHATVAGVILALFIPSEPKIPFNVFNRSMRIFQAELANCQNIPKSEIPTKCQKHTLNKIIHACLSVYNPMSRLEYNLHGFSAFIIMPLFAFANTGVTIDSSALGSILSPVGLGIIFGLLIGKPVGIISFVKLGEHFKLISLPKEITRLHLLGAALLAGIGLTMSIFIASMAFDSADMNGAKISILSASVIAGIAGYFILRKAGSSENT